MKKFLASLLGLLCMTLSASAQQKIVITLANGEKIEKQVWEVSTITFEPSGTVAKPDTAKAVDLGLSVLWGDMNFGSASAEKAGYYVGWGDATGLNTSTLLNYFPVLHPTADIINGQYDIVHVLWGGKWRMPSTAEVKELIEKCDWTYDATRKGWIVASKSDNTKSIFLPLAGQRSGETVSADGTSGAYWTGSLSGSDDQKAFALTIDDTQYSQTEDLRYLGFQIRPVYGEYTLGVQVSSAETTNITKNEAYVKVIYKGNVSDATEFGVCYGTTSSLDPDQNTKVTTSSVDEDGSYTFHITDLTPNTTYYFAPYVVYEGSRNMGTTMQFTTLSKFPVAEAVDLGLSVKWASWNVGASTNEETGNLMAWGDPTGENASFTSTDYPNDLSDISGSKYDVATQQWGSEWRMPTTDEWKELDALSKEIVTLDNGVTAYKVTGKNGNYIYLPRGGYSYNNKTYSANKSGCYWASENQTMDYANSVTLGKVSSTYEQDRKGMHMLVRPVYGKKTDPDNPPIATIDTTAAGKAAQSVDLGLSVKWATYNLGATTSTEKGSYFQWACTEAGTDFTRKGYKWYNADKDSIAVPSTEISYTDYDAAKTLWGGTWRMPTQSEMEELVNKCTWTKESKGYKVTGANGNSIFLPFTGIYNGTSLTYDTDCYYWSSTYNTLPIHAEDFWAVYLSTPSSGITTTSTYVYRGMCIRPVRP